MTRMIFLRLEMEDNTKTGLPVTYQIPVYRRSDL
jgi:hypothetical protein